MTDPALLILVTLVLAGVGGWVFHQMGRVRRRAWLDHALSEVRNGALESDATARTPAWAQGLGEILEHVRERLACADRRWKDLADDLLVRERAFQDAPLALFVVDASGTVEAANHGALALLERTAQEILGRTLGELWSSVPPGDSAWIGASQGRAWIQRAAGTVEIQVLDRGEAARRVVAALETASSPPRRDARADLETIGRFAGSVAHDFNDLLTSVLGRTSVLVPELVPGSPIRRELEEIMDSVEQARLLTRQLLAFSRRSVSGRSTGVVDPEVAEPAPARRAACAEPVRPEGTPATICVVEDDAAVRRFVTLVLERAGHAVLHAGSGPEALEVCRAHPGAIDLLVTDVHMPSMSGPILHSELLRERPELRAVFMSGMVEREAFQADLGQPCDFVQKPFTASELLDKVRLALERGRRRRPPRVLVVDDEESARLLVRSLLRPLGVEALFAADGHGALSVLELGRVQVVLCDMVMPGLDGIQTLSAIRSRWPALPVIAMTGKSGGRNHLAVARELGAAGTLLKPFSTDELALALEPILGDGLARPASAEDSGGEPSPPAPLPSRSRAASTTSAASATDRSGDPVVP